MSNIKKTLLYTSATTRSINGRPHNVDAGVVNLTQNSWTLVTLPLTSSNGTKTASDLKDYVLRYIWNGFGGSIPANEVFYISDIYGVEKEGKIFDFTEENVASSISGKITDKTNSGVVTASMENGFVKISKNVADWVELRFTQSVDLSEYRAIQIAVYTNATSRSINGRPHNEYATGGLIALTQNSWTWVTLPLTSDKGNTASDLKNYVLRYIWDSYKGTIPANEVFYISDIYGVK